MTMTARAPEGVPRFGSPLGGGACKLAPPAEELEDCSGEHTHSEEGAGPEGREHPVEEEEAVRVVYKLSINLWPLGKVEVLLNEAPHGRKLEKQGAKSEVAKREGWSLVKLLSETVRQTYRVLVGRSSKEVIGWLQEKSLSFSTLDVTDEFERNLAKVVAGEDELPSEYDYLFIPGYLWRWIPTGQYFTESLSTFNANGLNAFYADAIASEGTVDANAAVLRRLLLQMYEKRGNKVVLIGHSKGGVDALAAVARYKSELAPIVRGIVCLQSPIGGSPVASDLVFGNSAINLVCKGIFGAMGSDFESLRDLTYESRKKFFSRWGQHWPVQAVPVLCFSSKLSDDTPAPCSISRLLAAPATYIGLRYGHKSDGAVTECDAELPGTMVVRAKGALSHMSTVLPSPKGGLTLSGHKVEAWQINKAAVATILAQSNKRRYRGSGASWGDAITGWLVPSRGATTDDMHAYEQHSKGKKLSSSMKRSKSHESFSWSPLPQAVAKPPVSYADQASRRYHLSKCTSSVGDEFALAHSHARTPPADKVPPRVRMEAQVVPKRKLMRADTFTMGSKGASKARAGYLSQEPWMQDTPAGSESFDNCRFDGLDLSAVGGGGLRSGGSDVGCNPPTPLKDVNPPPKTRSKGLVGSLLSLVW